jgi:hypothetical protein
VVLLFLVPKKSSGQKFVAIKVIDDSTVGQAMDCSNHATSPYSQLPLFADVADSFANGFQTNYVRVGVFMLAQRIGFTHRERKQVFDKKD